MAHRQEDSGASYQLIHITRAETMIPALPEAVEGTLDLSRLGHAGLRDWVEFPQDQLPGRAGMMAWALSADVLPLCRVTARARLGVGAGLSILTCFSTPQSQATWLRPSSTEQPDLGRRQAQSAEVFLWLIYTPRHPYCEFLVNPAIYYSFTWWTEVFNKLNGV